MPLSAGGALCDDWDVMTHPATAAPVGTAPTRYEFRRATRDLQDSIVGGVASGLARHLAVPVAWVRAGFVVATVLSGLGVVLYAGLWVMLPAASRFESAPPGIESATRGGRRPSRIRRLGDLGPVLVLAALGLGALFTVDAIFGIGAVLWPVAVGAIGVALLWRQADEAQRERWLDATGRVDPVRVVLGDGGWASYARLAAGLGLIIASFGLFALRGGSLSLARDVSVAALLGVIGLGVVAVPWIFRLATELTDERAERVRTQERADVAAHLHDSVLQTLALIQKNADDPGAVSRLARSQERDLRSWLYVGDATGEGTVAGALRAAAAEIEDAHGISVDVVTVGDVDLSEHLRPIVAACRESVTNAAKHAGVPRVDVYAEISGTGVDVFVRDRGVGFDPEQTPADRYGVRHSIIDRMHRHGGTAEVRSAPGEGTEVRLHLPVSRPDDVPETGHEGDTDE
ncbi:ATP-binding protein [soil metagenome]